MPFLLLLLLLPVLAQSESLASFPKDIKSMILVKQSIIPGKEVTLPPETPLFLQETVKMYNWINQGQGTKLNIYVPVEKLEAYQQHGPYADGITAVAIYEDQDIVFITEHLAGETLYGTFDRQGNDISHTHPSFAIETCYRCHDGYSEICKNGTCATPIIDIFKK
jgi:hypothetical protein